MVGIVRTGADAVRGGARFRTQYGAAQRRVQPQARREDYGLGAGGADVIVVVGVCQVELSLPGVNSLKGKRSIVRRVVDRTANRFNVAVAEVDEQDVYRRAVVGFAVVSSDGRHANSMLDNIVSFIEGVGEAIVVGRSTEIVHMGRDFGDLQ